jgi:hypothetical protein
MTTRALLIGAVMGAVVIAGIAMFGEPAYAQKVKLDVSAKNAASETAKIKVECANDCDGSRASATGTVQCPGRKTTITCAESGNPLGSILFYSGTTTSDLHCTGGRFEASFRALPAVVKCADNGSDFGPPIAGKIENQPAK